MFYITLWANCEVFLSFQSFSDIFNVWYCYYILDDADFRFSNPHDTVYHKFRNDNQLMQNHLPARGRQLQLTDRMGAWQEVAA